jgi:hypothetical protein
MGFIRAGGDDGCFDIHADQFFAPGAGGAPAYDQSSGDIALVLAGCNQPHDAYEPANDCENAAGSYLNLFVFDRRRDAAFPEIGRYPLKSSVARLRIAFELPQMSAGQ